MCLWHKKVKMVIHLLVRSNFITHFFSVKTLTTTWIWFCLGNERIQKLNLNYGIILSEYNLMSGAWSIFYKEIHCKSWLVGKFVGIWGQQWKRKSVRKTVNKAPNFLHLLKDVYFLSLQTYILPFEKFLSYRICLAAFHLPYCSK